MVKALRMESMLSKQPVNEEIEQRLRLWGAGVFRLVVVGEVKRGKSSFINALLGVENLVPVSPQVATSTIYKIRYGREVAYRVHFIKTLGKQPLDIAEDELAVYGTENGNPGNAAGVDYIEVSCPAPLLRSGIVVIDTPGLGGLNRRHREVTERYIPRADAVFFVTDSTQGALGALELEYLKNIRQKTPFIYFVQTKIFSVSRDARESRKQRNLSILADEMGMTGDNAPYFMVDSQMRFDAERFHDEEDLESSGYPNVLAYINNVLQENQQKLLVARALITMQPVLVKLQRLLQEKRNMLEASTEAQRAEIEREIQAREQELADWSIEKRDALFVRLDGGIDALRAKLELKCRTLLKNSVFEVASEKRIREATSPEELEQLVDQLNNELKDEFTRVAYELDHAMEDGLNQLLGELVSEQLDTEERQVYELSVSLKNPHPAQQTSEKGGILSQFGTIIKRKGFFTGAVSGSGLAQNIANIATKAADISGLAAAALSGLGLVSGFLAGGIFLSLLEKKISNKQTLDKDKESVLSILNQNMARAHDAVLIHLRQGLSDRALQMTDKVDASVQAMRNELAMKREELKNRARMDAEEMERQQKELAVYEQEMESIQRAYTPWIKILDEHFSNMMNHA